MIFLKMNKTNKQDIRNIDLLELKKIMVSFDEKEYKSKQIFEWVWRKSKTSFDSMLNISLKTKDILKQNFVFNKTKIKEID